MMKFTSKKKLRRKIQQLEWQVKSLKEDRDSLPFYNKYNGEGGEKTPLGQVSMRMLKGLEPSCISNQVHIASDILANEDEMYHFRFFIETDRGVFARTIETESEKELEAGSNELVLKLQWATIFVGKTMTIFDAMIVHRGRIVKHVEDMQDMWVTDGDKLNINYTFTGRK